MSVYSIFEDASQQFNSLALETFAFQYKNNAIYQEFCNFLKRTPSNVTSLERIPFLPIEFFKTHSVIATPKTPTLFFTSSGTTGMQTSKHFVFDENLYVESFRRGFELFYGSPKNYVFLALLPSYLERTGSSLIYMVADLIKASENSDSGFYLHNLDELAQKLKVLDQSGKKVFLIGVSFALLHLIEKHSFELKNTIVMETGGMKGQRKEMIRQELHQFLKKGFGVSQIHSEYGMTELLSQAYSQGEGIFTSVPWLRITTRDPEDALTPYSHNKTGGVNIIDLANRYSCSFIATHDLGKTHSHTSFEILGRFDNADIRGCNLLVM